MNTRIETAKDCISEILFYILVLSADVPMFILIIQKWPGTVCMMSLMMIPFFYYLVRIKVKQIIVFFVLHVLPLFIYSFYPGLNLFERVIMTANVALFMLISISTRLIAKENGRKAVHPGLAAGIIFILYMVDQIQGNGVTGGYLIALTITYIICYFVYYYLDRYLFYIHLNIRTDENVPVRKSFYSATALAAGFCGISFFSITLLINRDLADQFNNLILSSLYKLFVFLLVLLPQTDKLDLGSGSKLDMGEMAARQEPVLMLKIIETLFRIVSTAILILLAAAFIVFIVRFIRQAFIRFNKKADKKLTEKEDRVESLKPDREKERDHVKQRFFTKTPEQKIRKIYYHTMLRRHKGIKEEKLLNSLNVSTARECCKNLFQEKEEEAEVFAELYEKARYGNGSCTREDVKTAKELAAALH